MAIIVEEAGTVEAALGAAVEEYKVLEVSVAVDLP